MNKDVGCAACFYSLCFPIKQVSHIQSRLQTQITEQSVFQVSGCVREERLQTSYNTPLVLTDLGYIIRFTKERKRFCCKTIEKKFMTEMIKLFLKFASFSLRQRDPLEKI